MRQLRLTPRDHADISPLMSAAKAGGTDVVELLLKHGAGINAF